MTPGALSKMVAQLGAAVAAAVLVTSCASVEAVRSPEGMRAELVQKVEKTDKPRGRSPEWIREHCPDCGGNGPKHAKGVNLKSATAFGSAVDKSNNGENR